MDKNMRTLTKKVLAGAALVYAVFSIVLGGVSTGILVALFGALIYGVYEVRDLLSEILDILKSKKEVDNQEKKDS